MKSAAGVPPLIFLSETRFERTVLWFLCVAVSLFFRLFCAKQQNLWLPNFFLSRDLQRRGRMKERKVISIFRYMSGSSDQLFRAVTEISLLPLSVCSSNMLLFLRWEISAFIFLREKRPEGESGVGPSETAAHFSFLASEPAEATKASEFLLKVQRSLKQNL